MAGMHALHEILANCAQAQPLPEMYRAMIQAGGAKAYLEARLAAEAARV